MKFDSVKWQNNGKLRLLIMVGTRPEIIRLSCVIRLCREHFDCILAHTGQNYDYNLNGIFFKDLELAAPEVYLDAAGGSLGETMGNIIASSYELMKELAPDALLILGDTNSCLCAVSAKRLHIPVFHMEAGNRCWDERLPEETNRRIVDIISDVNLPYSQSARDNLLACGLPAGRVFVTGSPMAEVLDHYMDKISRSDIHERLGTQKGGYILLSAHREENVDDMHSLRLMFSAINSMAEKYDMPVIYSCHPRSLQRLEAAGITLDKRIRVCEPFSFTDYNRLQADAFCVVSDSGTLPEESSYYTSIGKAFPAVSIRTSTERPEALERACFVLSGIEEEGLLQAVELARSLAEEELHGTPVPDYLDKNVSTRVVTLIQSMTGRVSTVIRGRDEDR
ncbi:MAG: UDP-N-acetyl glucosamine 2-epimerase [Lachnospiraceae bacterium]|nr:UDP-N-acetyl glucosamine 2-epimerase [Lachnospiraceae bacterium]